MTPDVLRGRLKGLLPSDFEGAEAPPMVFRGSRAAAYERDQEVEILDARTVQIEAASEADFLAEHAFVLLPHKTSVTDWDTDVGSVYRNEISTLISERLLPGRRLELMQAPWVIRRGGGRGVYGLGVHSDGPLTADVYARNLRALASEEAESQWLRSYSREEVSAFILMNFWRPTDMQEPVRHLPLAVCDPSSVERNDMFPVALPEFAPQGHTIYNLALRHNPAQRWYYYPEITNDEVLAFKLCQFCKDEANAPPQNVFHTAFHNNSAPPQSEERKSCEHRVGVFVLKN